MTKDHKHCYECNATLEKASSRPKRCKQCTRQRELQLRKADPIKSLRHRLYNTLRKRGALEDPTLWSRETVQRLWDQYDESEDHENVSIVPRNPKERPRSPQDLVIVASSEARSRAKRRKKEPVDKSFPEAKSPASASSANKN